MSEVERTVANVARQRSTAHVDDRVRDKEITPQDILRSTAIVLTQLVQVSESMSLFIHTVTS
jgi:hypothetical protein